MMMTQSIPLSEGLVAYTDYLIDLEEQRDTDTVPPIPNDVLRWLLHVPLLATFTFDLQKPVIRTLSIARSQDRTLPDLLIRRDLTPGAEPYQVPFAVIPGPEEERPALVGQCLRRYLDHNGVGTRTTSRPLMTAFPAAVLLCPVTAIAPLWVASSAINAAEKARLDVDRELDKLATFGTAFRDRARQETRDAVEAVFARVEPQPTATGAESVPEWPAEIDWGTFRLWWNHATAGKTVESVVAAMEEVWVHAGQKGSSPAVVGASAMHSWLKIFTQAHLESAAVHGAVNASARQQPDLPWEDRHPESRMMTGERGLAKLMGARIDSVREQTVSQ